MFYDEQNQPKYLLPSLILLPLMIIVMLLLPIGITISFILLTKSDRVIGGREKGHKLLTLFNLFAIFWLSKYFDFWTLGSTWERRNQLLIQTFSCSHYFIFVDCWILALWVNDGNQTTNTTEKRFYNGGLQFDALRNRKKYFIVFGTIWIEIDVWAWDICV